ncbi:MAG: SwmB domain-containing protein, partial [Acidobacteria bacterium]|nr:SwmB domain-containing protein [Acidobacteriota bacterium]
MNATTNATRDARHGRARSRRLLPLLTVSLIAALAVFVGSGTWLAAPPAAAQTAKTLIANTGQTDAGGANLSNDQAQAFTTGSNADGYTLTRLDLEIAHDTAAPTYSVHIYTVASGDPATSLGSLTKSSAGTSGTLQFTTAGIELDASTTYFVVIEGDADNAGDTVGKTASQAEDSGGATGWSIANDRRWRSAGSSSWTTHGADVLQIAIHGSEQTPGPIGQSDPTLPAGCGGSVADNTRIGSLSSTNTTVTVTWGSIPTGVPTRLEICEPGAGDAYSSRLVMSWASSSLPSDGSTSEITGLTADTDYWIAAFAYTGSAVNWVYIRTAAAASTDPSITIAADTSPVTEGTAATFTVTADSAPTADLTVNLTVADVSGSDFVASGDEGSQTVTIAMGATTATHSVPTTADSTDEPDGDVSVTVETGTGYTVGATASAMVTVNDDDAGSTPMLPTGCTAIDSTTPNLIKTVTSTTTTVTVTFGSAANRKGGSFLSICEPGGSGTYTTRDAQTWEFAVAPLEDDTFEITGLTAGTDYWVQYSAYDSDSAWDYIRTKADASSQPTITIAAGTSPVTEGTAATFTVTASPAPSANLTVNLTVADASGSDFVAAADEGSKTVTINASATTATYSVPTTADSTDEPDGDVTVTVGTGTGYSVGATASAMVTVHDDDAGSTPPTLSSATVEGATLVLTFSDSLVDTSVPAATDFEVRKTEAGSPASVPVSLTGTPSISGRTVTLTLPSAVLSTDTVTVSYTKPSSNPLQDAAGNQVAGFTQQAVTNNAVPTISSAWVSGSSLTIAFDASLAAAENLANSAFTVKVGGSEVSLSTTAGPFIDFQMVTLTLASAVTSTTTDSVTVSYSQPTTGTDNLLRGENTSGTAGRVASFTDQAVGTPPNFVSATVNGTTLTVTFDENLDTSSLPAGTSFSLWAGAGVAGLGTGTASISGMTATVTLDAAVDAGQFVFLNYVNPTVTPLQDAAGNDVPSFYFKPVTNNTPAVDKTAPTLLGGTIDASTVRLYFSEDMDTAAALVAAQFTVTSTPTLGAVSSPTWSTSEPNILTLTTATAANTAQNVTISISATAGVQDAAGNVLAAVDGFRLTNIAATSRGAPTLSSAEVDGDTLTLTYDQRLLPRYPLPGDFTVSVTGTTTTVSSLAINPGESTSTVVLTLSTTVTSTDTVVTVSYSKASGAPRLQNEWGDEVAALSERTVTNKRAPAAPPPAKIWSSWLTVYSLHGDGCVTPSPNADPFGLPPLESDQAFACRHHLTDDSFMHGGTPYQIVWMAIQGSAGGDEHLVIGFNPIDDSSVPVLSTAWTLHVDSRQFPAADSSLAVEGLEGVNVWTNPGFSWTAGQRVWLCLTTGGASCPKPATPVIPPPDYTAPTFSSAVVDRAKLTVTFNEALDENSGSPDRSAFEVTVDGSRRNIALDQADSNGNVVFHGVAIDGRTVTLTLESAVAGGQIVTLAYTKPTTQGGSPLRDPFFNNVEDFSGKSVTNNTERWLPEVLVRGVKLTLLFDLELDPNSVPDADDFEVKVNGQVQSLADPVTGNPSADPPAEAVEPVAVRDSRVVLTLNAQAGELVSAGGRVTLTYTAGTDRILGYTTDPLAADPLAADFSNRRVRNLASDRTSPTLTSAWVQSNMLTLIYSEPLDPDTLSTTGYLVLIQAEDIEVTDIAANGKRVTLTLAESLQQRLTAENRQLMPSEQLSAVEDLSVEITYNIPGGRNLDYAGNPAARIRLRSVTHGPPPAITRPPSSGGTPSGGGFVGGGGGGGGGPSGPSPSAVDFEWNVQRDIEALDSGHDNATGLWGDGETLLLLENGSGADDAVYAYDAVSGERTEEREFELDRLNRAPRGIWADARGVAWVSDSGRNKLFAYDLASGERLEDRDIDLDRRNAAARGIWSDGETMWVLDGRRDALFAYDFETGEALAEYRLHATNDDPHDLWSDGVTIWVSNHDPKRLFAYRLPELPGEGEAPPEEPQELERVLDEVFDKLSRASNNSPRGIWSDGAVMYVADALDGRVYSYNMPDAIDARLASLTLAGVDFGEFSPARREYEGGAGTGALEATVEAVPAQDGASVVIEPPDADGEGGNGHQVTLEGLDEITVTVTSEDGSRTRVYRVALAAPEESTPPHGRPEEQPWAHSLKGAVAEGFSLLVYEGGSVEELTAAAESRGIAALYVLHEGRYVAYFPEAPDFVNRAFAA